jgi:hypothetical protein
MGEIEIDRDRKANVRLPLCGDLTGSDFCYKAKSRRHIN